MPGQGRSVAEQLRRHGLLTLAQLQGRSAAELALLLGGAAQARLAARLAEAAWGVDGAAVMDRGPPKSIQVRVCVCVGVGVRCSARILCK
jgi:hypothetical protein